ncbi:hypothetical protein KEM55_007801 [Ascosphaera atra]|nr:hypothetical protein KEM55_007801 [Ascosphaera atra]
MSRPLRAYDKIGKTAVEHSMAVEFLRRTVIKDVALRSSGFTATVQLPLQDIMVSWMHSLAGVAFALSDTVHAISSKETGQTVKVNGIDYYAPPNPISSLPGATSLLSSRGQYDDLVPLTVMVDSSAIFTAEVFEENVQNFTASDDVFNPSFLQGKTKLEVVNYTYGKS